MKQKFLFVRNPRKVNQDTMFYFVMSGNSRQELIYRAHLRRYATNQQCYFKLYSAEVAEAYDKILSSLFPGVALPSIHAKSTKITTKRLLELLNTGEIDCFESHWTAPKGTFQLLSMLTPSDVPFIPKMVKKKGVPTVSRRHLSQESKQDRYSATVGFLLVLAIYLIGCRLEYLFF